MGAVEDIEKLTKALEAEDIRVVTPTVHVQDLKSFHDNLSPAAKALVDKPYRSIVRPEGGELRYFCKVAQHPLKPWYGERLAELFNDMVAAGKAEAFFAVGSLLLTCGEMYDGLLTTRDVGPDEYAAVFLMFFSKDSQKELGEFIGDPSAFVREGEVPSQPHWWALARKKTKQLKFEAKE